MWSKLLEMGTQQPTYFQPLQVNKTGNSIIDAFIAGQNWQQSRKNIPLTKEINDNIRKQRGWVWGMKPFQNGNGENQQVVITPQTQQPQNGNYQLASDNVNNGFSQLFGDGANPFVSSADNKEPSLAENNPHGSVKIQNNGLIPQQRQEGTAVQDALAMYLKSKAQQGVPFIQQDPQAQNAQGQMPYAPVPYEQTPTDNLQNINPQVQITQDQYNPYNVNPQVQNSNVQMPQIAQSVQQAQPQVQDNSLQGMLARALSTDNPYRMENYINNQSSQGMPALIAAGMYNIFGKQAREQELMDVAQKAIGVWTNPNATDEDKLQASAALAIITNNPDLPFDLENKRVQQQLSKLNYFAQLGVMPENIGQLLGGDGDSTGNSILDGVYEMKKNNYPFDRYDANGKKVGTNCLATFTESSGFKGNPYEGVTWIPTAIEIAKNEKNNDWHPIGDGYKPKPGDIAIVMGGKTGKEPDGHAVMVNYDGGTIQNSRSGNNGKGGIWEDKRSPEELYNVTGYISTSKYSKPTRVRSGYGNLVKTPKQQAKEVKDAQDLAYKNASLAYKKAVAEAKINGSYGTRGKNKKGKKGDLESIYTNDELHNNSPENPLAVFKNNYKAINSMEDNKEKAEKLNSILEPIIGDTARRINSLSMNTNMSLDECKEFMFEQLYDAIGQSIENAIQGDKQVKQTEAENRVWSIIYEATGLIGKNGTEEQTEESLNGNKNGSFKAKTLAEQRQMNEKAIQEKEKRYEEIKPKLEKYNRILREKNLLGDDWLSPTSSLRKIYTENPSETKIREEIIENAMKEAGLTKEELEFIENFNAASMRLKNDASYGLGSAKEGLSSVKGGDFDKIFNKKIFS